MQENKIVKINEISIDGSIFYEIEGYLNLDTKKLNINILLNKFEEIFGFQYMYLNFNPHKLNQTIFIKDENNICYTCFNCIFGWNIESNFLNINIKSSSVNLILKNYIFREKEMNNKNFKINRVMFKTSFPYRTDIYKYVNSFSFKYFSNKNIKINFVNKREKYILEIEIINNNQIGYKKLYHLGIYVLELIFIILGDIPKIEDVIFFINNETVNVYERLSDKYNQRKAIEDNIEALLKINKKNFTPQIIKKYISFRKKTGILIDMLLINMNTLGYIEIKNSMIIQIMEGFYRSTIKSSEKYLNKILKYYLIEHPYIKNKLLTSYDLKEVIENKDKKNNIFLVKCKYHRNYLSHLNMNDKPGFIKEENIYAYWKLKIALRLFIISSINEKVDSKLLNEILDLIEKWRKKHRLVLK